MQIKIAEMTLDSGNFKIMDWSTDQMFPDRNVGMWHRNVPQLQL